MTEFWDILKAILLIFISGIVGYYINEFHRRGKVNILNYSLLLKYHSKQFDSLLHTLVFDIQIINKSEKLKQFEINYADFTVGSNELNLNFKESKFPPVFVLKEKSADIYTFELKFDSEYILVPVEEIHNNDCMFRLCYTVDKEKSFILIPSKDFKLLDTSIKSGVI